MHSFFLEKSLSKFFFQFFSLGKGVQHHEGQLVVSDEKLITMANVKLLANNVNR